MEQAAPIAHVAVGRWKPVWCTIAHGRLMNMGEHLTSRMLEQYGDCPVTKLWTMLVFQSHRLERCPEVQHLKQFKFGCATHEQATCQNAAAMHGSQPQPQRLRTVILHLMDKASCGECTPEVVPNYSPQRPSQITFS